MKKLMFAAALTAAMTGVCDVTSSNCVGYQNSTPQTGGWDLLCNTFVTVGKDKTEMTLGDFIPNAKWNPTKDRIQFLTPGGATATYTYNEVDYPALFTYVSSAYTKAFKVTDPGWYQTEITKGKGVIVPADAYPIQYGDGFVVEAHVAATTLNFSGEVQKGAQNLTPVIGGWHLMGNALPVPTKLSEVTPNAKWNPTKDRIQFLTPGGATATYTYNEVDYPALFTYVSSAYTKAFKVTDPGWYQTEITKGKGVIVPAGNYDLAAGQAFVVEAHVAGTEIQFPAALND